MSGDTLLRAEEVARILNTSVRTLDGWRRQGVGPPWVKLSRRAVRYAANGLTDWVATRPTPRVSSSRSGRRGPRNEGG